MERSGTRVTWGAEPRGAKRSAGHLSRSRITKSRIHTHWYAVIRCVSARGAANRDGRHVCPVLAADRRAGQRCAVRRVPGSTADLARGSSGRAPHGQAIPPWGARRRVGVDARTGARAPPPVRKCSGGADASAARRLADSRRRDVHQPCRNGCRSHGQPVRGGRGELPHRQVGARWDAARNAWLAGQRARPARSADGGRARSHRQRVRRGHGQQSDRKAVGDGGAPRDVGLLRQRSRSVQWSARGRGRPRRQRLRGRHGQRSRPEALAVGQSHGDLGPLGPGAR